MCIESAGSSRTPRRPAGAPAHWEVARRTHLTPRCRSLEDIDSFQVAVGGRFSCGLESGGEVWCLGEGGVWGRTSWCQRSSPRQYQQSPPMRSMASCLMPRVSDAGMVPGSRGFRRCLAWAALPVERFVDTHADCLQLAGAAKPTAREDMFNNSTGVYDKYYSPIQPVRVASGIGDSPPGYSLTPQGTGGPAGLHEASKFNWPSLSRILGLDPSAFIVQRSPVP